MLCSKFLCLVLAAASASASMEIGIGVYDVTGPIEGIHLMGMANPAQIAKGLHIRLRARTFVGLDTTTGKRIAFVSIDAGMGSIILNNRVIDYLNNNAETKGLYTLQNVAISGTHSHSGPSGFLQDMIFQLAGSGFVPETINSFVTGVAESIIMAHKNLAPATGFLAIGEVLDSNINRSPTAYANNTEEERARYDANTDLNMTVLKISNAAGDNLAMFNWFSVHPTSMNNTNLLVSGDNKGYASYYAEREFNGDTHTSLPGHGKFVAAFASTNLGDASPNTKGAHCQDTGLPCDAVTSTCNGAVKLCVAAGPGKDMFESTEIIGRQQAVKAIELYTDAKQELEGSIDFAHMFVQMPGLNVTDYKTGEHVGQLCLAAMGDSFAAGTTDGPGMFNFKQGNGSNPIWNMFGHLLSEPTAEQIKCQAPKPILLNTGGAHVPFPWGPNILPIQILKLGQLVILSVPTEMTTMSGRRTRDELKRVLVESNVIGEDGVVVIAGLTNGYADYTTTFEEYHVQRYEGGSTIFGPHQLNGYIQELSKLARSLNSSSRLPPGPTPDDFSQKTEKSFVQDLLRGKVSNTTSDAVKTSGEQFGQVVAGSDITGTKAPGTMVSVTFNGANSLNDDLRRQGSYVQVQRCDTPTTCTTVAVDGDWETRVTITSGTVSVVKPDTYWRHWQVDWYIPLAAMAGDYKVVFSGKQCNTPLTSKRTCKEFSGQSSTFHVANATTTVTATM
eukprot:m.258136 g.258136  ORF g.258136 m.258136 type:complete len:729 (-) comp36170_c0_seq1:249-2435(-)